VIGSCRTFRVTHPFHPDFGREFALLTYRHNWGEQRVYFHDDQGRLASLPASSTDVFAPDPFVRLSSGRSPFRLQDLLELVRILDGLAPKDREDRSDAGVPCVNAFSPIVLMGLRRHWSVNRLLSLDLTALICIKYSTFPV
jgi:hypothetical protein